VSSTAAHHQLTSSNSPTARWQVIRILDEEQTDAGFKYKVIAGKGPETRTLWQHWTDLDLEVLEGLLKGFKAGQRSMRRGRRDSDSTRERVGRVVSVGMMQMRH